MPCIAPYYEEPGITIYHGDCRDVLPHLPKVDLVLTDPPYGIGVDVGMSKDSGRRRGGMAASKGTYPYTNWDAAPPDKELLRGLIERSRSTVFFGGNYFDIGPARCYLVWDKLNGDNAFADCELIWTNLDKPVRIKRHMWNGMLREGKEQRYDHPTQKPLPVIAWCIQQAGDVNTILDPYMGSGTTLVAAKQVGIRAIGIEIEEKYCDIAVERLRQDVLPFTQPEPAPEGVQESFVFEVA